MYDRVFSVFNLLEHRSVFPSGSRRVGRSTFLQLIFPELKYFNLLKADTFSFVSGRPESVQQSFTTADRLVIIDEAQKLPLILDEIQMVYHKPWRRTLDSGIEVVPPSEFFEDLWHERIL